MANITLLIIGAAPELALALAGVERDQEGDIDISGAVESLVEPAGAGK